MRRMALLRVDVQRDWDWSDGYLPEVRRILAQNALHLVSIRMASFHQDVKQATDMLLTIGGERSIAVRLRRAQYHYRDLTIRAQRTSGITTELEKIRAGHGDFYLYGWTDGPQIAEWMLVDLHRLRASGLLESRAFIRNTDGQTQFLAIDYHTLAAQGCVVAARVMR